MEVMTLQDCRKAGFCVKGVREVCRLHGVDWRDFVRNGMPVSQAETYDDANIRRVLDDMKKRKDS